MKEYLAQQVRGAILRQRIEALDWAKAIEDVKPFVESAAELELLTQDNLSAILGRRRNTDRR